MASEDAGHAQAVGNAMASEDAGHAQAVGNAMASEDAGRYLFVTCSILDYPSVQPGK